MSSHESTAPETTELEYDPDVDHEPEQDNEWLDEESELTRRPRRRLLTPIPLALLAVLLIACGFIGGVLVQKGQGGTASPGAGARGGFPSLSALKGALPGAGGAGGTSSTGGSGPKGGASAFPGIAGTGSGGVTTGEVAYVRGNTLYVTDSEGNTVKVKAAAGSKVTKTVSTKASSIHPGATVVVLGSKAEHGSISASSISVSSAASGNASSAGSSSSSAGASSSSSTPTLFGPG